MNIQVVGSGCPTCKKLYEATQQIATELGITKKVEYLSGPQGVQKIIELGAMSSPLLLINDQVVMVGFTSNPDKIKNLILKASKA